MLKKLALFCLLCSALSSPVLSQTTRTVCASGCDFTTIQAAVNAANAGDVILLNVNGTFTEKNIVLPEKNLTFRGLGKTTTILQSATSRASASGGRIFRYPAPVGGGSNRFTFEDMTVRYAYAPMGDINAGQSVGGVFYAYGTLKGLTVTANRVKFYANETTAGNSLNSGGSCFYISATGTGYTYNADLSINDCDFDDNKVGNSSGTSLSDGPCFNLLGGPARLSVNNSTFTNNNGYTRGGVLYVGSSWVVSVANSLFENNTCRNGDGGCFSAKSGTSYAFDNCLFKNNSAVFVSSVNGNNGYGGVYIGKGAGFKNCTFYGNAAVKGGAICRSQTTTEEMQLLNCTFSANTASSTGKTIQYGVNTSATVVPLVMVNTLVANGGGTAPSEIHTTFPYSSFGINLKNYCNSISTENATPGTAPVFAFNSGNCTLGLSSTLANNGGNLQTLALSSNSSMMNAGSNVTGASYEISVKDQRNYSRTDGSIDIGAYEYGGVPDDADLPVIAHTALGNTLSTADRTVTATVTDNNGVYWYPQTADRRPRLYFRKNSGSWSSAVGTLASGTGFNGTWNFTVSASAMGGLSQGDRVDYYIVAQDVSTTPAIASAPSGINATDVNTVSVSPPSHAYLIGSTLPVKLEVFNAVWVGNDVAVSWQVSEERNLSHYNVERSTDAVRWVSVGQLTAANRRTYQLLDRELAQATYFYRLRSTDKDGRFTLSAIRKVRLGDQPDRARVYPNPVTGNKITVAVAQQTSLRLYTTGGVLVWQKNVPAGTHEMSVDGLARGTYQLVANDRGTPLLLQ